MTHAHDIEEKPRLVTWTGKSMTGCLCFGVIAQEQGRER